MTVKRDGVTFVDQGGASVGIPVVIIQNKTLKRKVVALTVTGEVIALVATKKLKIFSYAIQSRNDSMTVQFRDGTAGNLIGLRWTLNAREGAVGPATDPPTFLFNTTAGNNLQAVITGTGTIDIEVSYFDDDSV